ncbi:acyltransferase family protein [Pseudomonas sp. IT-P395]|jgi:peptidoglycan/LPS O-acetylase OafA/YrhL|uniref:acyltransferase family protein n=1 Tax=Pseudomonas sp. IT-P395 TaxID=3026459 RepID=UPI0039E12EFF
MTNPNLKYRRDIDGLRALAVISVVIFHAFPTLVPGGFVGVDIFFVISGFLIGTILLKSIDRGTFSFSDFYARRIRRIFPALTLVLITCWVVGKLVLLPNEMTELSKHIAAGAGFVANFAFWYESGYFDTAAELKPLLHLWSLAIEEQFYLLFPMILWAAWKVRLSAIKLILAIGLVSLILNLYFIGVDPNATFYLLPTRAWELLAGTLLAWACLQPWWASKFEGQQSRLNDALSAAGLALIFFALFSFKPSDQFPGWRAILPVLGSVLLIAAGPSSVINRRIFSTRVAVAIGLISFPLYLWHWPLLAFARIVQSEETSIEIRSAAVAASILLAWITYSLIEKPLRAGIVKQPRQTPAFVGLMIVIAIGGFATYKHPAATPLETKNEVARAIEINTAISLTNCATRFPDWNTMTDNPCLIQDGLITSAVIGDSHAAHLFAGLSTYSKADKGLAVFPASCAAPFYDTSTAQKDKAAAKVRANAYRLINEAYDYASKNSSVVNVLLAHNPKCSWEDAVDIRNPGEKDFRKVLESGMRRSFEMLSDAKKNIVVVLDNPTLPFDPSACVTRPFRITEKNDGCSFPRKVYDQDSVNSAYNEIVQRVAKDFTNVKIIDLASLFCDSDSCYAAKGGKVLYNDRNHLSMYGSQYVAPYILKSLRHEKNERTTQL